MVVRMRHTKSHTRNRRSHHAIKHGGVSVCPECGAAKMAHRACASCGMYRGKKITGKKEGVNQKRTTTSKTTDKKTETKKSA